MATCVIFAGGPVRDPKALRPLVPDGAFVIAADGGYRLAAALGIRPDLLVGDFDSLEAPPDDVAFVRLPAEKDETDTLAAVNLGLSRGCDRFLILGALGGRFDHSLANLATLLFLAERGAFGLLADGDTKVTLLGAGQRAVFSKDEGRYLSVFCFGGPCTGLCESGVRYPLLDHTLNPSSSLGVSNQITEEFAEISIETGYLTIVLTK